MQLREEVKLVQRVVLVELLDLGDQVVLLHLSVCSTLLPWTVPIVYKALGDVDLADLELKADFVGLSGLDAQFVVEVVTALLVAPERVDYLDEFHELGVELQLQVAEVDIFVL